jgi:cytochrome c553
MVRRSAKLALGIVAGIALAALYGQSAIAQGAPVSFTAGQATGGEAPFLQRCSACHGETLQGLLEAPPLTGRSFDAWRGKPVKNLYDFMVEFMPQDEPGKLAPQTYADILAFILAFNKVPPGDKVLEGPPPADQIIPR